MLQLNNLTVLTKKRKRVGRGGKRGGHCGRGNDGQLCRSGGRAEVKAFFEGGQMPLARRVPCRGFNNALKKNVAVVKIADLEKKFDSGDVVDIETLTAKGLLKGQKYQIVKVLGSGALTKKLTVTGVLCSKGAHNAIEQAGGVVNTVGEMSSGGAVS